MSIAVALSHIVLIPLCLIGNGLVVVAFLANRRLRTSTNVFVVGLAVSDLLVGIFAVPFWMYVSSYESISNGICLEPGYSVYIGLDIFSGCASILQLTAISLERYLCISSPMRHRKLQPYVYYFMVACAWSYAILMAGLMPLQAKSLKIYTLLLFITCFACPLIIITTVYAYVFKVGHYHARGRNSSIKSIGCIGGTIKEMNLVLTVAVFTSLFMISWLPFFVVNLTAALCPQCLPQKPWQLGILIRIVKWMQYANCCINPYVYACRHVEMKQSFIKICVRCFGRKPAFLTRTNSTLSYKGGTDNEEKNRHPLRPRGNSFTAGCTFNQNSARKRTSSFSGLKPREMISARKSSVCGGTTSQLKQKNGVLTKSEILVSLERDGKNNINNANVQHNSLRFGNEFNKNSKSYPHVSNKICQSTFRLGTISGFDDCEEKNSTDGNSREPVQCCIPCSGEFKATKSRVNFTRKKREKKVQVIYL